MLFPTLKKEIGVEKKFPGVGGGGGVVLTKNVMLFSRKYCPFTYWLNERWFLQIVDRDSGNLYPLFPCSDFYIKCGGGLEGGGGIFF